MQLVEQKIPGVFIVKNFVADDKRGRFIKTFNEQSFMDLGLETSFRESYYSVSKKNVIRGMHFQEPPDDHNKLVYAVDGEILDVILDLRRESKTFKTALGIKLANADSIYIPRGCAHGFLTLTDSATIIYNVSTGYNKDSDKGILWNSFGFEWGCHDPIISDRDLSFPSLESYESQF